MAGAEHSGEEMQTGRTNRAENRTRIWAQQEQGESFDGEAIFIVEAAGDLEDADFTQPTAKLHGILGRGFKEGVGVIGLSPAAAHFDSSNVRVDLSSFREIGVLGKGPTGVVGEGCVGVEGIGTTDPLSRGLAGAGVVGRGSRRVDDEARDHGPGVVGIGGSSDREPPSTDSIAGGVGVLGQGADGHARRRPRPGVVGRGGSSNDGQNAAGVVGMSSGAFSTPEPLTPLDTGVLGLGGTGVSGRGHGGPGVYGRGGPSGDVSEVSAEKLQAGVVGYGGVGLSAGGDDVHHIHGCGVIGVAGDPDHPPPPYAESGETGVYGAGQTGVYGAGQTGVKGIGTEGRGGIFAATGAAQLQLVPTPAPRIAEQAAFTPTVATDPGTLGPPLPRSGLTGDLMTTVDDQGRCTLWFCVRSGGENVIFARWSQVLLGPAFPGRG